MTRALVALGSNKGDRRGHLLWALRELGRLPGTRLLRASALHPTKPVGGPPQGEFLNAAALISTSLTPMGLLVELKRLEAARGRRPGVRWGPRPLDLDILFIGRLRVRGRFLRIPHPLALSRAFALIPAAEVAPGFTPPGAARSLAHLARSAAVKSRSPWPRS